jgi:transcriptional regulator with XRE-family HTH domain
MGERQSLSLRAKMLGATMRMARKAAKKSLKEAAALIGTTPGLLAAFETGRRSISLPELELYAYHLHRPLRQFWEFEESEEKPIVGDDLPAVLGLRNRMIAAVLHGHRTDSGLTVRQLAEATGLTTSKINAYERGDRPIPIPHLEALAEALDHDIQDYVDRLGPVGDWDAAQRALGTFMRMPTKLREFIANPENRPYLELARRMSDLSTEKLRGLGEGLIDITE